MIVGGRENSSLESKLQLSFGCTIQLLIDGSVVAVKDNVGAGRIAISLEDENGSFRHRKKDSKLEQVLTWDKREA